MNQFWSGNECERAYTLTTTTTDSKNSLTMLCPPPQGLSFTGLRTQLKSSARHTLSNQQAQLKRG